VVNVETGAAADHCDLNTNNTYTSLTFSRQNGLYASRSSSFLDQIDPCTCDITPIGDYGIYTGVAGITSDQGNELYGVASTQDVVIAIDTQTGMGMQVGALGVNFQNQGATWSDGIDDLYGLNANLDQLFEISHQNGAANKIADLNLNFGTVGMELHPQNGVIYACTSDDTLYEVDPQNGDVDAIGAMGQGGACSNLAAPWFEVGCIDN
jgi:hypothetical protein